MSDDFDLQSLAEYLHLDPAQVARLAERQKIPSRRVQGNWRFARAEIHHWLENRIGVSGGEELAEVESMLRPTGENAEIARPSLAERMPLEAIEIPLAARTRGSVIQSLVDVAARTGLLWDVPRMAEAVRAREDLHPTALDSGVAMLHPRRPMPSILGAPLLAFGRTDRGIPFGGRHGADTDLFFLICSLDDRDHLQFLARLSRLAADPDLLALLRAARDAQTARELLLQADADLP
jgi:PTS system nitrogen regulatory IIA component